MQELPARGARAPQRDLVTALGGGLVEAPDERRQDVRGLQVEVVARAVQVRRHRRDVRGPVLLAVRLDLDDAGDLREGVGLVGRLQRAGQQGVLADRLRGQLRVDAGGTQEQQSAHAGRMGTTDHAELDLEVLLQELHRVRAVGHDPADLGGGQHHGVRADVLQVRRGRGGVAQVEVGTTPGQHLMAVGGEPPGDRGSHEAAVARDEDAGVRGQERQRTCHTADDASPLPRGWQWSTARARATGAAPIAAGLTGPTAADGRHPTVGPVGMSAGSGTGGVPGGVRTTRGWAPRRRRPGAAVYGNAIRIPGRAPTLRRAAPQGPAPHPLRGAASPRQTETTSKGTPWARPH